MSGASRPPSGAEPRAVGLVYVVTVAATAGAFLRGQLEYMRRSGFSVTLVASPSCELGAVGAEQGVEVLGVPMERSIRPAQDIRSLVALIRVLRRVRPEIVNYGTPKAGLLAGVAAVVCRVPYRVYTLHGLRLEGARRPIAWILTATEWIACRTAHRVVCVSPSLRDRAVAMRLVRRCRTVVLAAGSCNGVDVRRFRPAEGGAGLTVRTRLGIAPDAPVIGYVGRLTRDKGVRELLDAYRTLRRVTPDLRLLLVGGHDDTDPVDDDVRRVLRTDDGIVATGWVDDALPYYRCMDVFAFPTYREGLGQVALEASACGVPVVASDATGARDAVIDGVTGLQVPRFDADALVVALGRLLADPALAARLGAQGRSWVSASFSPERIWSELTELYGSRPRPVGPIR